MPKKPKPEPAPDALKRERAGTYRSVDGRFTVEQSSSGWMVLDAEQTDGLGLPLARGPFATLDDAEAAMTEARTGEAPAPPKPKLRIVSGGKDGAARTPAAARTPVAPRKAPKPIPQKQVVIRELRAADGDALRKLWKEADIASLGDDDRSLVRMARRNPGLVLVAVEGTTIVGSALGGWDGRRGWIYHLATAKTHRRQGIASRLLDQIEAALTVLGAPRANAMVERANEDGRAFWTARGYTAGTSDRFGKEL
ncbi:MAG TPA: GNAT family N-acetyltransferase [Candidatus Limnocylindrales bacterium]|nr:GNAT family N-acetyltransferase [Candidatus Limnocylindrales bacterium]